jgi:hypothetical protein
MIIRLISTFQKPYYFFFLFFFQVINFIEKSVKRPYVHTKYTQEQKTHKKNCPQERTQIHPQTQDSQESTRYSM